jgi:hypothetical protein
MEEQEASHQQSSAKALAEIHGHRGSGQLNTFSVLVR